MLLVIYVASIIFRNHKTEFTLFLIPAKENDVYIVNKSITYILACLMQF